MAGVLHLAVAERQAMQAKDALVMEHADLDTLLGALHERGYETVGPTVRDEAIVYRPIERTSDLPAGWTDEQDAGRYRLLRTESTELFGHAVGPHSWKRYLLPPELVRWQAHREDGGFVEEPPAPPPRYAFVGVRPCELAALAVLDRVLGCEPVGDPDYRDRRAAAFILAVNCSRPSGTCFCVSMGTGPRCGPGYDLALTEIPRAGHHALLIEIGTERGAAVAGEVPHHGASSEDIEAAAQVTRAAARRMGRSLVAEGLPEVLGRFHESPHWEEVARRCLTCGNCTIICPTCFCTSLVDGGDLSGTRASRRRVWDSCFGVEFSYVHGGSVRTTASSRCRQWMMHKLATWHDQFETSGCVGCGRCITWCPVGIDITEEMSTIRLRDEREVRS